MHTKIKVETVTLPAFLASALVNGDFTGFDAGTVKQAVEDYAWLNYVLDWVAPGQIVSTVEGSENEFASIMVGGKPFVGAIVDYVVHYYDNGKV